jgi:hypothetical protein
MSLISFNVPQNCMTTSSAGKSIQDGDCFLSNKLWRVALTGRKMALNQRSDGLSGREEEPGKMLWRVSRLRVWYFMFHQYSKRDI